MNICVDGLALFLNNEDIGNYLRDIVFNFKKYSKYNLNILKDSEINVNLADFIPSNVNLVDLEVDRINQDFKNVSNFINDKKIDIYHCFNNGFSLYDEHECFNFVTIHSLIALKYEEFCSDKYVERFLKSIPTTMFKSDKIITLSYEIKNDLIEELSIEEEKINVIYPGISNNFRVVDVNMNKVYLKSRFSIDYNYILFCSDFHERKRIEELTELFFHVSLKYPNMKLIFLIKLNSRNIKYINKIKDIVSKLSLDKKVVFITNFTELDKVNLLNNARCIVDFSIYDGVNLSLIQALKCRCPIICSNIEFHKELLSDYAFYFDIEKLEYFCDEYEYILEGKHSKIDNTVYFKEFISRYSFEKSILYLENVYKEVIN